MSEFLIGVNVGIWLTVLTYFVAGVVGRRRALPPGTSRQLARAARRNRADLRHVSLHGRPPGDPPDLLPEPLHSFDHEGTR